MSKLASHGMAAGAPDAALMRTAIGKIATGPEYSRDLDFDTARSAMTLLLRGSVDPAQAAVFLVALRMKRETDAENLGLLAALQGAAVASSAPVAEVVDIADPYDGYIKGLPAAPFLPAVLAACRVPAVCHGSWSTGPKHGVSHAQVLAACGCRTDLAPEAAAQALGGAGPGWAYVDLAQHCPALHALAPLRELIVKRSALSTLEKLLRPIRGRSRTHLLTGFVHKAYPRVYALLGAASGFDSALVVRGMEGGVLPSLRQRGHALRYTPELETHELEVDPAAAGISQSVRMPPLPETTSAGASPATLASAAALAGLDALRGARGATRDALVYAAALVLWHIGRADSVAAGAETAREVIDSGAARARFEAARVNLVAGEPAAMPASTP